MDTNLLLQQLDSLYNTSDISGAEALLNDALTQCRHRNESEPLLTVYNELIGLYRQTGRVISACETADHALTLITDSGLTGTMQHGITLLNAATANRCADHLEHSLAFYLHAEIIFLQNKQDHSYYMASLYNNVSQLYQDREEYESALHYQKKALALIQTFSDNDSEIAITKVNMSHSYMFLNQLNDAQLLLEEALAYFQSDSGIHDPHYGAALCALGRLSFLNGHYQMALRQLKSALEHELSSFGENDACRIIRANLDLIYGEMKRSGRE